MTTTARAAHKVVKTKLHGTPYTCHTLYLGNVKVYASLSPLTELEIEQRITSFLNPQPIPAMPKMVRGTPGRKPKAQGATSPTWRTPTEDEPS